MSESRGAVRNQKLMSLSKDTDSMCVALRAQISPKALDARDSDVHLRARLCRDDVAIVCRRYVFDFSEKKRLASNNEEIPGRVTAQPRVGVHSVSVARRW